MGTIEFEQGQLRQLNESSRSIVHVGEKLRECPSNNPPIAYVKENRAFSFEGKEIVSDGYIGCSICKNPVLVKRE